MQPEIPRIKKNGSILNKNREVQSKFAKYEDIRRVVDPILRAHGFTFHPVTDRPATGVLEVVGTLEHEGAGRRPGMPGRARRSATSNYGGSMSSPATAAAGSSRSGAGSNGGSAGRRPGRSRRTSTTASLRRSKDRGRYRHDRRPVLRAVAER